MFLLAGINNKIDEVLLHLSEDLVLQEKREGQFRFFASNNDNAYALTDKGIEIISTETASTIVTHGFLTLDQNRVIGYIPLFLKRSGVLIWYNNRDEKHFETQQITKAEP